MLNHMVSIKNKDNTSQWQTATSFVDKPHPDNLQRLADLTGRSVTLQSPSETKGITESRYHPSKEDNHTNIKRLIVGIVEGRL